MRGPGHSWLVLQEEQLSSFPPQLFYLVVEISVCWGAVGKEHFASGGGKAA